MYRPNRIGPAHIANLDKVLLTSAQSDFAAEEVTVGLFSTVSLNTTSGDQFIRETKWYSDAALHLSAFRAVGLGVQVSGVDYDRNYVYEVSGNIQFTMDAPTSEMEIQCVLGRLSAAPHLTAPVLVTSPVLIPLSYSSGYGSVRQATVKETIVTTILDGGTPPTTEFDICAYWRIINSNAVDILMSYLQLDIGMYRYVADLETNDPNR